MRPGLIPPPRPDYWDCSNPHEASRKCLARFRVSEEAILSEPADDGVAGLIHLVVFFATVQL